MKVASLIVSLTVFGQRQQSHAQKSYPDMLLEEAEADELDSESLKLLEPLTLGELSEKDDELSDGDEDDGGSDLSQQHEMMTLITVMHSIQ